MNEREEWTLVKFKLSKFKGLFIICHAINFQLHFLAHVFAEHKGTLPQISHRVAESRDGNDVDAIQVSISAVSVSPALKRYLQIGQSRVNVILGLLVIIWLRNIGLESNL